ncbi:hypothetical protein BpHYR1_004788 [Brachionus plicatilis]|uniref:Uncharacterized protein n=1 Tax=Brachionus plicatilis TaxID=10195 RepID=A0A3M7PW18_BRAPC|nr:hypothetical protein BpHYR1_004788 [Brachionus plicatilis]
MSNLKIADNPKSFDRLNLLPCDHYEYEFKQCSSLRGKFLQYYRGEEPDHECKFYQDLFVDCLKYEREPANNLASLLKLKNYEQELVKKRKESLAKNDVWKLRKEPPSDWNAALPEWAEENIKDSYWFKSRNNQKKNQF